MQAKTSMVTRCLWAMVLLVFAGGANAQDTRIVTFKYGEELVWTNTVTNAYCGVEWTSHLQYPWQAVAAEAPYWNIPATQTVMAVANFGNLTNLWDQIRFLSTMVGDPIEGVFLRIVSSPNQLGPQYVTNSLSVVNNSASDLSNVVLSAATSIPLGTLTPNSSSQWIEVAVQWPKTGSGSNIVMSLSSNDWALSFTQNGTNRTVSGGVFPYGPAVRLVSLAVSNDATCWKPVWLPFERMLNY